MKYLMKLNANNTAAGARCRWISAAKKVETIQVVAWLESLLIIVIENLTGW